MTFDCFFTGMSYLSVLIAIKLPSPETEEKCNKGFSIGELPRVQILERGCVSRSSVFPWGNHSPNPRNGHSHCFKTLMCELTHAFGLLTLPL